MFEVIPGVLENNWQEIEKKLRLIKPFAKTVHVDIIDGIFAPNRNFLEAEPFKKYSEDFLLELHMMVDEPINYLKPFAAAGFKRFIGHIEKMKDPVEFVAQGQLVGEVGIAIDGPTSIDVVKGMHLEDLDEVIIMTIKAGASGQQFQPELLEKVRELRKMAPFLPIEVDGGINSETILQAKESGANRFIANSYLFKGDPNSNFESLNSHLNK